MKQLGVIWSLVLFCLFFSYSNGVAQTNKPINDESKIIKRVFSKGGNLFCKYQDDKIKQITYTGIDTDPAISPNKKLIAFVRNPDIRIKNNSFANSEIWLYDLMTNKNNSIVQPSRGNDEGEIKAENILGSFGKLAFSNDGQNLYFISEAWATTNAIHVYNVPSKKQSFLTDGNTLYIIRKGKYKDHLIVNKHKYFNECSYDYFWLLDHEGKEIREIGETEDNVQSFLRDFN